MVDLSLALSEREEGVVLGYASSLDGGVEAVYWHRFPFVRGRYYDPSGHTNTAQILSKLADDFDARYIWADKGTLSQIQTHFPDFEITLSNDFYYVLEYSPNNE